MTTTSVARRRGGLFWHRDFRLLWIGESTSRLGSSVTLVALPLVAIATLHASTFQVAALTAAEWVPWLLIGLPAGAWVDRWPRRPVLLACDLVSAVGFVSVPLAAWAGLLTVTHLLVVAVIGGVAAVFFTTAYQVYLPGLLPVADLPEGNAKMQGSEAASQVAGPGLAGLLTQAFGAVTGLLVDALSFLVSAGCLVAIRHRETPPPAPPANRRSLRREIAQGMRFVAGDRYLRVLTVFGAAANVVLTGADAIRVVFLIRGVGLAPATVGVVLALGSCGGLFGALLATRLARRFGTARTLLLCQLVGGPFALLTPLTGPGWRLSFAVLGSFVVGAGVVAGNVIKGSFRQAYCPRELLGRVMVSMQVLNLGAIPLGALLGGVLGSTLGLRPTMWLMCAALPLTGLILFAGPVGRRRDLPTGPAAPPPVPAASGPLSTVGDRD